MISRDFSFKATDFFTAVFLLLFNGQCVLIIFACFPLC